MGVQTSYTVDHVVGYAGSVVDSSLKNIISKMVETGPISQGLAVTRGTGDNQVLKATATGADFMGVAVATTAGQADSLDAFEYQEDSAINLLGFGRIYVICENGCVPGDAVFFRHTVGTGSVIGAFRTDADTATADEITNATFESTAGAGELAILQLS
ncbi:MAG: hypothetical protein U9Q29_02850 [Campylobacterota bacterium]|nr:hypothetical protein [Campylobacterota bacterium]